MTGRFARSYERIAALTEHSLAIMPVQKIEVKYLQWPNWTITGSIRIAARARRRVAQCTVRGIRGQVYRFRRAA